MNSNHDNGKTDQSLTDDLDQIDQLYRGHGSDEPPEMLDQAILNKARRAVEAKNGWLDFGWIHGVTTIGLVVLTLSIFTTQRDNGEFEPTLGESVDPAAIEVTGELSGQTSEAGAAMEDLVELQMTADDDAPMANQPLVPVMEEQLAAPKEVMKQESREREQDSPKRQMRAPASTVVATPQADKQRRVIDALKASTAGAPATSNEDTLSAKKQDKADQQFRSMDELKDGEESAPAQAADDQQLQMLEQILTYKSTGDERWVEELAAFKTLYPDFPLPDELE